MHASRLHNILVCLAKKVPHSQSTPEDPNKSQEMTAIEYEIKRKLLVHVVIPVKLLWSLVMVYMLQDLAKVPSLAITPKSRFHNQIPLVLLFQTILFFS